MSTNIDPIGIYAAIVASVALIWNIIREKPKVTVYAERYFDWNRSDTNYKGEIEIIVINKTKRPIKIREIGFIEIFGGKKEYYPAEVYSPSKDIKAEDRFSYMVSEDTIETYKSAGVAKYFKYAYAKDGTNKIYKGRYPKDVKMILVS